MCGLEMQSFKFLIKNGIQSEGGECKGWQSTRTPGLLASVPGVGAEIAVRSERTNADEMLRKRA